MNWDWYWHQLLFNLLPVLPWFLVGLAGLGVVSFSPLGRSLVRHFKERREETALLEELVMQITAMRQDLADVTERLDGTDRLLRTLQGPGAPMGQLAPPAASPPPVNTPH